MVHDEAAAIEELQELSENARNFISHHFRHLFCLTRLVARRSNDMELIEMVWQSEKQIKGAGF